MLKFIHAADLHLDSALRGLERYDGAPVDKIRQATRSALRNLVQLAIDERVAFVLLAGDIYDGDWKDYHTGLFFLSEMRHLREAAIPVYLITGNHDAANRMTRTLRLPDSVTMLSADEPQTELLTDAGVAIHGQGFAHAAVTDDLSLAYPEARRDFFNIGLLHTSATGREGHERYAPCTIDGLRSKAYDYWALGHVHKREMLCEDPVIAFPGNIQGRHIRESGAKGCLLVTVDDDQTKVEFKPLDILRWERLCVEAIEASDADTVVDKTANSLAGLCQVHDVPMAVRVEIEGPTPAHEQLHAEPQRWLNELRSRSFGLGSDVWIEQLKLKTSPPRDAHSLPSDGPMGELRALLDHLRSQPSEFNKLCKELKELEHLTRKLPVDLGSNSEMLAWENPSRVAEILDQVEATLMQRLLLREDG